MHLNRPGTAAARACLILIAVLGAGSATAVEIPPIVYSGQLQTSYRATLPETGEQTLQQTRTIQLGANSFIWQPWFATVAGDVSVTQSSISAEIDSDTLGVTGGGNLRVFPSSRFPFEAFFNVSDSQTDTENLVVNSLDTRRTRVGAIQRYQTVDGRSNYSGRLERTTQTETFTGDEEVSDRLALNADYRLDLHSLNVTADLERSTSTPGAVSGDTLDLVLNARHNYRPSDTVTMQNFASFTSLSSEFGAAEATTNTLQANSFATWRPTDIPLLLSGSVDASASRFEALNSSSSAYNSNANVTANYAITDALRATGSLRGTVNGSDAGDTSTSTSQLATLTYSPPAIPLGGFSYSWSTGASASNTVGTDVSDRSAGGNIGHNISRGYAFGASNQYAVSVSASQNAGVNVDTRIGARENLGHGASVSLNRAVRGTVSQATFAVSDSRTFGADSFATTTATLQASHQSDINSQSFWRAGAAFQAGTQRTEFTSDTLAFSSVNLQYGHRRLFGVNRLRFTSELRAQSDSLVPVQGGEDDRVEINWDNRVDYSIGRVVVRFRGLVTQFRDSTNTSLLLTISRSFGGVY